MRHLALNLTERSLVATWTDIRLRAFGVRPTTAATNAVLWHSGSALRECLRLLIASHGSACRWIVVRGDTADERGALCLARGESVGLARVMTIGEAIAGDRTEAVAQRRRYAG